MATASLIEDLPKRLSLIATCMLVVSIGYDYFFFLALGLSLSDVPTTLSDHARSAVLWAPVFLMTSVVGFLAGISSPPSPTPTPGLPLLKSLKPWEVVFFVSFIFTLLLVVPYLRLEQALLMLGLLIGGCLMRFQPGVVNVESLYGQGAARQIYYFLCVMILAAQAGYSHGLYSNLDPSNVIQLVVKQESGERVVPVRMVRRFTGFVVSVGKDGVTLWPSDSVLRVQYPLVQAKSIGCLIHERFCPGLAK
jgi:hypothetical protein